MLKKTREWWHRILQDPTKLNYWLVKLYWNEKDAEERFIQFANDYCLEDEDAYNLFLEIAIQEKKHSVLVKELLTKRGVNITENTQKSKYFDKTMACALDKETAAAVGAFAESLSLKRIRYIVKYADTPSDIKEVMAKIEPEEAFHAMALSKLAGKHGMKKVFDCHDAGLEALGLKIKNSTVV